MLDSKISYPQREHIAHSISTVLETHLKKKKISNLRFDGRMNLRERSEYVKNVLCMSSPSLHITRVSSVVGRFNRDREPRIMLVR